MRRSFLTFAALLALSHAGRVDAAGTLTSTGSPHAPIAIRDHHVAVVIQNGFARTEVTQTFFNPNAEALEALYAFPLPASASLSEMTIFAGERELDGEVLSKDEADRLYGAEKQAGNDAGLASKNDIQSFEFRVFPVPPQAETRTRFVYYQPIAIDTGVGRYLYPLEEGGTDEQAKSFWLRNDAVEGTVSADVDLWSAWPVVDVRVPGFDGAAVVEKLDDGHWRVHLERQAARLANDFVLYYRLADDLPGSVELIPYRAPGGGDGTFMLVITPGLDLQPLAHGVDWVFVLDTSGSMAGKIATLARGVGEALGHLRPDDRFRIVTFSDRAREETSGWIPATPDNVRTWVAAAQQLAASGSTNLYDGLEVGLRRLDADRATNVVLVTDGVTNTGVVDPRAFHALMQKNDVRVFGFLMGNGANWPLMRTIAEASGGFYDAISNGDDLLGRVLLAKSKVTHEALHDVAVEVKGVRTSDLTGALIPKVYRGQQLVLFGHYAGAGDAELTIRARKTGEDHVYRTHFAFPEADVAHPEVERLWALATIEELGSRVNAGLLDGGEAKAMIRDLGVRHQIVTDETSMVVLADEAFERHGVQRQNRERVARERVAQAERLVQAQQTPPAARNRRVDSHEPAFHLPTPSLPRGGGGAIDPASGLAALALAGGALLARRRKAPRA
jgi:Ca-activated chloride channel family protein